MIFLLKCLLVYFILSALFFTFSLLENYEDSGTFSIKQASFDLSPLLKVLRILSSNEIFSRENLFTRITNGI